ncbi:MAG: ubiquinone/menaquinone biosynthesis methyltransferase [Proteobacteria bacterium]|nr:ubiquinone/menaquinone biosynthesis methyltransferase [Pseudomonadota bacterium]
MFSAIAPSYDLLNRLMSFGTDTRWRKKMTRQVLPGTGPILDLATGTADVALLMAKGKGKGRLIVGADFTLPMLHAGAAKIRKRQEAGIALTAADACCLPFPDGVFQAATIAFGLRNIPDRTRCLREMARVLVPGGQALILEFSRMDNPVIGPLFRLYFHRVIPILGGVISGNREAYRYLPLSVDQFPDPSTIDREMTEAGFRGVGHQPMTWGIAYLHKGELPLREETK